MCTVQFCQEWGFHKLLSFTEMQSDSKNQNLALLDLLHSLEIFTLCKFSTAPKGWKKNDLKSRALLVLLFAVYILPKQNLLFVSVFTLSTVSVIAIEWYCRKESTTCSLYSRWTELKMLS